MNAENMDELKAMVKRVRREILYPIQDGQHPQSADIPIVKMYGRGLNDYINDACMAIMKPDASNEGSDGDSIKEEIVADGRAILPLADFLRSVGEEDQARLLTEFAEKAHEVFGVSIRPFTRSQMQCSYPEQTVSDIMRLAVAAAESSAFLRKCFAKDSRPIHATAEAHEQAIYDRIFEASAGDEAIQDCYTKASVRLNLSKKAIFGEEDARAKYAGKERPALTDEYVQNLFRLTMQAYHYTTIGFKYYPEDNRHLRPDAYKYAHHLVNVRGQYDLAQEMLREQRPELAAISTEEERAVSKILNPERAKD